MSTPRKPKPRSVVAAVIVAVAFGAYGVAELAGLLEPEVDLPGRAGTDRVAAAGTRAVLEACSARRSGVVVEAEGVVTRTLADDLAGSRHQRFVVRLDGSEHTVLIAHNIDLAERVPLSVGDRVSFRGEYEWNAEGGVVHWTHHDPDGRRPGGFVRHRGATYR